ncbi:MAG: hypothetical protein H6737_14470 [Alphaproteobacteria bacterium]|nr:hypothetical protein [Alphaproteobacteria bacterium]
MKKLLFGLVLLCAVEGESHALGCWPYVVGPSDLDFIYTDSSGVAIPYRYIIKVPSGYDCTGDPSPLVLMFHGGHQALDDFTTTDFAIDFAIEASDRDAVIIALEANAAKKWNHGVGADVPDDEHVEVVRALLEYVVGTNSTPGEMNIDRDQIHGLGFSNGGIFVQHLSNQMPNLFGAIAVIASVSGAYDTTCDPFAAGCVPASYDNVWEQSSPVATATDVDVMLVRGEVDGTFQHPGGWFLSWWFTQTWTLASYASTDPSEYGLWKSSVGCTTETLSSTADYERRNCTGSTDLRMDVVYDMGHELPTTANTSYDGPAKVATFLFNHPK